jgi:RNA ligase (TIGR02306 family)
MGSDCIVPVVEVSNVRIHPNADMLSIAEVLGYQVVSGLVEDPDGPIVRNFVRGRRDEKGRRIPCDPSDCSFTDMYEEVRFSFRYKEGSLAVYFPADTVLTDEWAEKFEVKHLLKTGNRVGRAKLRGEPSFGLVVELPEEGKDWPLGHNCAEFFDGQKWEPPADKVSAPDAAPYDSDVDPHFVKYTDIQNGRLLYSHFQVGEKVVATEKIHGKNVRIGMIDGQYVVGSRTYRKVQEKDKVFWPLINRSGIKFLLAYLGGDAKTVILFGEIYGRGIQSLHYGTTREHGFRLFDIYVDGNYLGYEEFAKACDDNGVERVPVLYEGPFDLAKIQEVADGESTLPGADNIREGTVVRPVVERRDPSLGRVILKFLSTEYELSKHKKKDTTDL